MYLYMYVYILVVVLKNKSSLSQFVEAPLGFEGQSRRRTFNYVLREASPTSQSVAMGFEPGPPGWWPAVLSLRHLGLTA